MQVETRWDKARFAVERVCTCTSRSFECQFGWHRVDGYPEAQSARDEAALLHARWGFGYRAVDSTTGDVLP